MSQNIGSAHPLAHGPVSLLAALALLAVGCRSGAGLPAPDATTAAPHRALFQRLEQHTRPPVDSSLVRLRPLESRPLPGARDDDPGNPEAPPSPGTDLPAVTARTASPPEKLPANPTGDPASAATPAPATLGRAGGLRLGLRGWMPSLPDPDPDPDIARQFAEAEQLYLKGDLDAAEKLFHRIDRKQRKPLARLFSDAFSDSTEPSSGSPYGMRALYYLGEIKFQKGDYVGAHRKFEELAKQYPGTNDMDKVVRREHEIARAWLDHYNGADPSRVMPWYARFRGGLPLFDTAGHAVAALEQVRLNDPKGPLADDALMTIAEHYYKQGDYETAAEYFDQMTDDPEMAKSPLMQKALLGGIDAKMKAYIGPEYDATGLEQAREAALRTMQLFPERQTTTDGNADLHKTLDLIADQEAERAYSVGSYYRRAGRIVSAEYYFGMIVHKWPQSEWAAKAREQLVALAKMPRKESKPSTMMIRPGSDPLSGSGPLGGMGGMPMGGMGGMPMAGPGGP